MAFPWRKGGRMAGGQANGFLAAVVCGPRQGADVARDELLNAGDYRRILAVVEAAEKATTRPGFRAAVLEALDEHLGLRESAFFMGPPPVPGFRAVDGILHGYVEDGVPEYVERWSDREPYACAAAQALIRAHGIAGLDEFFDRLDERHRRYVEDFLLPQRIRSHTNLWLDTGLPSTGWISILSDRDGPLDRRRRAAYLVLRPHLAELLRRAILGGTHRELSLSLSERELEVARQVASGSTNAAIARHLGVGEDTVKKHISAAMRKLRVRSRAALALTVA